ncbi:MAG: hypothetical protein ACJ76I_06285 [Gaiellaceae bacterium]
MALLTWICLLFLVVAVAGSVTFAAVRGLRVWRAFRRLTDAVSGATGDVMRRGEAAEEHAVALTEKSQRLSAATAHLQRSLSELAILRSAFANARSSLSFRMPTK